ncbi:TetR/AcrR family transcriptional regulator [Haliea sp. E17]|uniref:TetR/AcrR family transcriptional regulator n=1 Tax=Haliea sp. E17 TaxID=3401576 RepID=UPI003AABE531
MQPQKKGDISRKLILDATEKLMLDEGYGAVSTRRVATEAGLKAPLVHYYFPTTDDLFVALFKRSVASQLERLDAAGDAPDSLLSLWASYKNSQATAMAVEFMALANHREAVRKEFARFTRQARKKRVELFERLCGEQLGDGDQPTAEALAVVIIGIARTIVMEERLGISSGHSQANAFVERWLASLQEAKA